MRKRLSMALPWFFVVLVHPFSAWAQDYPKVELFGAYSYTRMNGENWTGWYATGAKNINHMLGITAEVGSFANSQSQTLAPYTSTTDQHFYTFLAGPQLTSRDKGKLAPYVHLLLGVGHYYSNSGLLGPIPLQNTSGLYSFQSSSENHFAMFIGGGIEYKLKGPFALRGQMDYGGVRFGASQLGGTSSWMKGWRFSAGLALHLGSKTD
ncbi:MAG: hypothetical protein ABSC02_14050 [Acidobacteriota bacterium]